MSKKKKFQKKVERPTLAASLEAIRQNQPSPVVAVNGNVDQKVIGSKDIAESRYVKAEMRRILLIITSLVAFLFAIYYFELRTGFLNKLTTKFIPSLSQ